VTELTGERDVLSARLTELRSEVSNLEDVASLQAFGVYEKRFDFPTSQGFDLAIEDIASQQKQMVRHGTAAFCTVEWAIDGSKREGQKFQKRLLTLMLRAFNGEADAAIAKVRYNNIGVMVTRVRKAFDAINKLTIPHHCEIAPDYLRLRVDELYLVHAQQNKLYEEREEQRTIREQMREEEVARREIERAKADAERDEVRYSAALEKARAEVVVAEGTKQQKLHDQIAELERRLAEAQANRERAIARAQMTRSGHVYIISNIGSFGENVYKIGMTRRLDPMERIHELSDASVPFAFDVHAVIFSDDAPSLENELHKHFDARRLNLVNLRKEFFCVTLDEISEVVRWKHADILITKVAEARDYRRSAALLAERGEEQRGWGSYDRRGETNVASSGAGAA
jgi:hypothetical protein